MMDVLRCSFVVFLIYLIKDSESELEYKGITFTNERYCPNVTMNSSIAFESLNHLSTTGANSISIIITQYQMNISSLNIFPVYNNPIRCTATPNGYCLTVNDQSLINTINYARNNLNLKVLLKPQIDLINDTVEHDGRNNIGKYFDSNQWNEWFKSYESFIVKYAKIAQETNVELFCVSTELAIASNQTSFWRESIIPVVKNVYNGLLTSAAEWSYPNSTTSGELECKEWWDLMDYIGCDEYYVKHGFSMINNSYPTLNELLNIWNNVEIQMYNMYLKWNKTILFTEIGYCSGINGNCYANDNILPSNITQTTNESLYSQYTQYEGVFISMTKYKWFKGIFWWNWVTDAAFGGDTNPCMDIKFKPTENLLRKWYNATEPQPQPPDYSQTCECWE